MVKDVLAADGRKALARLSAIWASSGEERVSGSTAKSGPSTSGQVCTCVPATVFHTYCTHKVFTNQNSLHKYTVHGYVHVCSQYVPIDCIYSVYTMYM